MRVNANLSSRIKLIWAVQSVRKKYSCFRWRQITGLFAVIPPHKRGVCAIVRKCEAGSGGRDASGAMLARTNDAFAYGEVVWS